MRKLIDHLFSNRVPCLFWTKKSVHKICFDCGCRWVFRQLWDKGFIYQGFRVMPYSTGCATPLSNFEATQNYKDVQDPAVTVSFPLDDEEDVSMVAWTTTPWTLPSNLALCVHPEHTYVKVKVRRSPKKHIVIFFVEIKFSR